MDIFSADLGTNIPLKREKIPLFLSVSFPKGDDDFSPSLEEAAEENNGELFAVVMEGVLVDR